MSYLDKFNFDEITTWDLKQVNHTVQHAVKVALPFILAEIEPHIGFMIKEQLKEQSIGESNFEELLEQVDLNEFITEDIGSAVTEFLNDGYADDAISERVEEVIDNGSFNVEVEFSN